MGSAEKDAIYHPMSRGNNRGEIFQDEKDRKDFLETLGKACMKAGAGYSWRCILRWNDGYGFTVKEMSGATVSIDSSEKRAGRFPFSVQGDSTNGVAWAPLIGPQLK